MALVVDLQITAGDHLQPIERLEIRRLTRLHTKNPTDAIHQYVVIRYGPAGEKRNSATFTHRYGDGAWKCTLLALQALEAS